LLLLLLLLRSRRAGRGLRGCERAQARDEASALCSARVFRRRSRLRCGAVRCACA
jgi:hypothetical protein